jgi:hypothetical protein
MYCPNCGSQNHADIKFCTRCGTNLAVVTEALTGKPSSKAQPDERIVKLLKNYYDGRRAAAVGGIALTIGLTILTLLMAAGMPEKWLIFGLLGLGCLIYGAIVTIAGGHEWIEASSEMKALGLAPRLPELARPAQSNSLIEAPRGAAILKPEYATDPIVAPSSVTEHTTRQLDESSYAPGLKKEPRVNE